MIRPSRVNPVLLDRARSMRKQSAPAEQILWSCLRDRQLNGYKFRRQYAIGGYIADFYCAPAKLVVELDGDSHSERQAYDERRTRLLEAEGLSVVRYPNTEVFDHLDAVLESILEQCVARGPSP